MTFKAKFTYLLKILQRLNRVLDGDDLVLPSPPLNAATYIAAKGVPCIVTRVEHLVAQNRARSDDQLAMATKIRRLEESLKNSEAHFNAAQTTIDSQNRELARRPSYDSIRFQVYESSVDSTHRFLDSVKVVGPGCVPSRVEALYKLYQKQESSIRELQDEVEKSLARVIDTVHKYDAAENVRTILRGKLDNLIKLLKERFDIHVNES